MLQSFIIHYRNLLMSVVKYGFMLFGELSTGEPVLTKEKRDVLFRHIKDNALTKEVYIDCINAILNMRLVCLS